MSTSLLRGAEKSGGGPDPLHGNGRTADREDAWCNASVTPPDVRAVDTLSPEQQSSVRSIQERAAASDGVQPLSEQTVLSLKASAPRVRHLLAYAAEGLAGYAQVDAGGGEPSAELVVDPDHRRTGHGRSLLEAVLELDPATRVWAHGNLDAARALATAAGLEPVRELHKMARPLGPDDAVDGAAALPAGFSARAFRPGVDEDAWLATNAAAFAHHAEQGRLTRGDLEERMAQPWFDPAGFILVSSSEEPERVAAFHWTKADPAQEAPSHPGQMAGEVYVVGVHPAYQGRGLGRPVTALGLAHLARLGLPEVVLYVDGDNTAALRTYTALGFRSIMVDVMYARVQPGPSGSSA